ncbi:MAG: Calcineurin-like phosphoesterase [Candidatus Methanolliviera sp. GoM_asphalt]|nr:MAG: Calcineurin-like phosphoesterase [Candidatus Methanolliviera sp. GoM_asphalt]
MRNKKIFLIFTILVLVCGLVSPILAGSLEDKNNNHLGQPFKYPDLPKEEHTPDYVFAGEPKVTVDRKGEAIIRFETVIPTSRAKIHYGLYLPEQEIKVPQYRVEVTEDLKKKSRSHAVIIGLRKFEKQKYDICNFKEKGGVICYRIEVSTPTMEDQSDFYDGRFRVDGDYYPLPCVIEGPFVDCLTKTSAIISWETDEPTMGTVEVNGKRYNDDSHSTHHEITVTGLSADTRCEYDVFSNSIKDFKSYHLKTAPDSKNSNFVFAHMSDSREGVGGGERACGGVNHHQLSRFMIDAYNNGADFVLFGGDLINGYTTNTEDYRMQLRSWKDVSEQIGCYIPIYEGMGNHEALMDAYDNIEFDKVDDDESKSAERVFAEEFVNPHNGPEAEDSMNGTAPTYDENVYYFDYANTRIISFNTNYGWCSNPEEYGGNLEGYVMDGQLEWIKEVLDDAKANSEIKHIFMFAHEPAFPNGGHLGDAQWYSGKKPYVIDRRDELWEAISNSGKVVAVFFGHEHNYSRMLIDGRTPVYLDGSSNQNFKYPVWQIVSGGAGAPFYAQQKAPWTKNVRYFYPGKNYCLIEVNGERASLKVLGDSGEVIDECPLKPILSYGIEATPIPYEYNTAWRQGIADDGSNWYISGKNCLYKTDEDYNVLEANLIPFGRHEKDGYDLGEMGYTHIGDIDYFSGLIYAPVEDASYKNAAFVIYKAENLIPIGYHKTSQSHMPWCAINPDKGCIYSSEFNSVDKIFVYNLDNFAPMKAIKLDRILQRVQGGVYHGEYLYISCDDERDYIYKINCENGKIVESFATDIGTEMEGITYQEDVIHFIDDGNYIYHHSLKT